MEDYPGSLAEFEERFATEAACLEYLARLRWPDGFVCPQCGANGAWRTSRGLWCCQHCGVQTSVTAGTIFHRTRKPLRLWFRTMWHITTQKYGANALGLSRVVEPGEKFLKGTRFLLLKNYENLDEKRRFAFKFYSKSMPPFSLSTP